MPFYLCFFLRDEIDATGTSVTRRDSRTTVLLLSAGLFFAGLAYLSSAPCLQTGESLGAKKGEKSLGAKRVEKSRERPTPFVCLQHLCCHIIFNKCFFGIGCWEPWKAATSHHATPQGPIVFHFNSHPLYAYQNQSLNPNPYFHHLTPNIPTIYREFWHSRWWFFRIFSSQYHLASFQGLVLDARLWWFGQCRAEVPPRGRWTLKDGAQKPVTNGVLNKPYKVI